MEKSGILWHIKGRTPRKLELLHALKFKQGKRSSKDRHLSVAGALYSSKAVTASRPGFVAETDRLFEDEVLCYVLSAYTPF